MEYFESIFVQRPPEMCFSHFTVLEWNVKYCFVELIQT